MNPHFLQAAKNSTTWLQLQIYVSIFWSLNDFFFFFAVFVTAKPHYPYKCILVDKPLIHILIFYKWSYQSSAKNQLLPITTIPCRTHELGQILWVAISVALSSPPPLSGSLDPKTTLRKVTGILTSWTMKLLHLVPFDNNSSYSLQGTLIPVRTMYCAGSFPRQPALLIGILKMGTANLNSHDPLSPMFLYRFPYDNSRIVET